MSRKQVLPTFLGLLSPPALLHLPPMSLDSAVGHDPWFAHSFRPFSHQASVRLGGNPAFLGFGRPAVLRQQVGRGKDLGKPYGFGMLVSVVMVRLLPGFLPLRTVSGTPRAVSCTFPARANGHSLLQVGVGSFGGHGRFSDRPSFARETRWVSG